jgi:CHAT domain-containing protein
MQPPLFFEKQTFMKRQMPCFLLAVLFGWLVLACQPSGNKPASTPENQGYSESDFKKDSALMWVHRAGYERSRKKNDADSMMYHLEQISRSGRKVLNFKVDSTTYGLYYLSKGMVGYTHLIKGEFDQVLPYVDTAVTMIVRRFGNNCIHLHPQFITYGAFYEQKGDIENAIEYVEKAHRIVISNAGEVSKQSSNMYWNKGLLYERLGDFKKASENYQKSADVCLRIGDEATTPRCYDRIGSFALEDKDYEKALGNFSNMLAFRQKNYPPTHVQIASTLLRIASVYLVMGDDKTAETFFAKVPPIPPVDSLGAVSLNISSNWQDLGGIYLDRGNFDKALGCFQKMLAVELRYSGQFHPKTTLAFQNIGKTYLARQQPDSALVFFQKALHSLDPQTKPDDLDANPDKVNLNLGYDLPEALALKAKALDLKYLQTKETAWLEKEIVLLRKAAEFIGQLRRQYGGEVSKQNIVEKAVPVFQAGVATSLELNQRTQDSTFIEEAFSFAEGSKSIILLEAVKAAKARTFAGIPEQQLTRERQLKIDLVFYQNLLDAEERKGAKSDSLKVAKFEAAIAGLQKDRDRLENEFKRKYPEYFHLNYQLETAGLDVIRKKIPGNTTLLEYFLTDSLLYTFAIDQQRARYFRQPIDSTFFQNIEIFRRLVHQFDPSKRRTDAEKRTEFEQFVQAGRALYQTLLEPALAPVTNHQSPITNHQPPATPEGTSNHPSLIIIPDGMLGYLPFQALLTKDPETASLNYRNLPYAVKDFNIRYEYSATLLTEDWGKSSASKGYLGIAPEYTGQPIAMRGEADSLRFAGAFSNLRGGIPALLFNKDEVAACAEVFGGKSLIGAAATEAGFVTKAKDYRILHLAMHALTNDSDPLYSQLVFFQNPADSNYDNSLHAYELYNMRLNADLAVLSACNTGAGKLVRGEGIMSLSRAFKYAGCPNILMSLWQVSDAAAKDLVVDFHQKLEDGNGKAAALQSAQLSFLKNSPEALAHPFYWATFVMVGDDAPVGTGWRWWWWLAGICIILAAGWLLMRRK